MDDVKPTLPAVPGIDVDDYSASLLKRFANPAISDKLQRLALDGSAKISTFVVPPLRENLQQGRPISLSAFALAAWCTYLTGRDERGESITIDDPMYATLKSFAGKPAQLVGNERIFGTEVRGNQRLRREVAAAYDSIAAYGTRSALQKAIAEGVQS